MNDHTPAKPTEKELATALNIVQRKFSDGLALLCDSRFLAKRYSEFLRRDDPIYVELLKGMQDEALAKTFVSYWTIAQTMATKSRFWLEDAVAEIIVSQVKLFGRPATHVYSQSMLGQGYYEEGKAVADIGEEDLEHLTDRSPWRPLIKEKALKEVDLLVGEQERERIDKEERRKPFQRRQWDQTKNQQAISRDRRQLNRVTQAVGGPTISDIAVQCNLLVVDPERSDGKPHVHAIRFVNPKTMASHRQRKQERANLLRLYAFLVQEKPFRDPRSVQVSVAELLPRAGSDFDQYDYYPDYFSSHTYWSSEKLWQFIGVPFTVVSEAIASVAEEFREQLTDGLTYLLPNSTPPPGWGRKRKKK